MDAIIYSFHTSTTENISTNCSGRQTIQKSPNLKEENAPEAQLQVPVKTSRGKHPRSQISDLARG
ncbi:MAG: hypothetical protein P8X95_01040 [Anaerolineales bacterium]|jgi:hypothetical protein